MKRLGIFLLVIFALLVGCIPTFLQGKNSFALADADTVYNSKSSTNKEFRAVENCLAYAEQNAASTIIFNFEKNQKVQVSDTQTIDTVAWCEVITPNGKGYIEASRLYEYRPPVTYSFHSARATVQRAGETIPLYNLPQGEHIQTVYDGAAITVLERGEEFSGIIYQGKKYYILNANIATGLTYYQRTAFIIGCIAVAAVALTGGLAYINKNKVAGKIKK